MPREASNPALIRGQTFLNEKPRWLVVTNPDEPMNETAATAFVYDNVDVDEFEADDGVESFADPLVDAGRALIIDRKRLELWS